ncbi:MAG: GPR endopeptidase [Clostridia bacterium]|nr:GPR endopeptidase [Clostridia bacterium]
MERISDLFIEHFGMEAGDPLRFPDPEPAFLEGFSLSAAQGKEGSYRSLFCGPLWLGGPAARQRFVRALRSLLASYRLRMKIPREGPVLVCGIGSEGAAADALGPKTASRILVTDRIMRDAGLPSVCAFRPGIPRETGISTAGLVRAAAKETGVALVLTVDALCSKSGERLGTVVQVTDCGLTPGSALGHSSEEISRETMPCPVLSVGVPTVVRASALPADPGTGKEAPPAPPLFVTRADTEAMVSCYASLIASAVNGAFSGNLTDEDMFPASRA